MSKNYKPSARRGAAQRLLAAGSLAGILAIGGTLAGLVSMPRQAQARQGAPALIIFQGAPAQSAGITLSSWGSGSITEDQKSVYAGSESLRIVTHGQFQGASVRFGRPVDLGPYVADKGAYFQIAVLLPATGANGGGPGGFPGSGGPGGGFNSPGSAGPPGFGSSAGPGGGRPGAAGATGKPKAIENLRVVLLHPNGKGTELTLPVANGAQDNQWRLLSIPVSAIPGVDSGNAKFSEIRLFGDNPGIMYVGRIGVVVDATPLKVEPVVDMIVGVRAPYRYVGSATAGPTPLKYSWDWDDKDGIQEESVGRTVTHTYYKEGDFTGTLTVSDVYGVKQPVSTKFKVHVHL